MRAEAHTGGTAPAGVLAATGESLPRSAGARVVRLLWSGAVAICLLWAGAAAAAGGIEAPGKCALCGMDRTAFAHSRALVTYSDGGRTGTCSIHCAVEHLGKSPGRQRRSLEVADYYGRELIDAESAVWVVGGGKSGVMTSPAKWAFAREERARRFVRENGGSITSFQAVLQAIKEEVAEMEKPPQLEQE